MRVPVLGSRSNDRADSAMTPLIDVVFLLLIFFVWTASFQVVEVLLPSRMTASTGPGSQQDLQDEDFERIVVRILNSESGLRWQINEQMVDGLEALSQRLVQFADIRADLPVVIDPGLEIPFGNVIDVYDRSRAAGLANIQFTTRR